MTLPSYAMNAASFPLMYERELVVPLFRPWVDDLFERVGLAEGDSLLDIACGTGIVARVARERLGRSARIVGVDVSAGMLAVAGELARDIDWREGNAMSLPVPGDEKFTVVACQQGLQFVPDKLAAVREMRRVLAPGGRVVVATWLGLEHNPLFRDLHAAAERRFGPIHDERFGFGDGEALRAVLAASGLRDVEVAVVRRTIRVPDAAAFLHLNCMAEIGMSRVGAQLDDNGRAHLVSVLERESAHALAPYRQGAGLAFEMATHVATARA
ncbi:MAG TPA: methyltransferase domain-containing protein [Gammaproteobacteria bacterium]